ncbi:MAG: hypothetical protein ACI87O_000408, partial [Planctomycetota bacterium]
MDIKPNSFLAITMCRTETATGKTFRSLGSWILGLPSRLS